MHASLTAIGLTTYHELNFRRLAAGLMAESLPGQFSMKHFRQYSDRRVLLKLPSISEKIDCNTVACALGYAPEFVTPAIQFEGWGDYCRRVFGLSADNVEWEWCFSGMWERLDNTAKGAGQRILYMLEHGVPYKHVGNMLYSDNLETKKELLVYQKHF